MRTPAHEIVRRVRPAPASVLLIRMRCIEVLAEWNADSRRWVASTLGHRYPTPLLTAANWKWMLHRLNTRLQQDDMKQYRNQTFPIA